MLLRLQRYDYDIVYRLGKEMVLADNLSRMPKQKDENDGEMKLDVSIGFIQF